MREEFERTYGFQRCSAAVREGYVRREMARALGEPMPVSRRSRAKREPREAHPEPASALQDLTDLLARSIRHLPQGP